MRCLVGLRVTPRFFPCLMMAIADALAFGRLWCLLQVPTVVQVDHRRPTIKTAGGLPIKKILRSLRLLTPTLTCPPLCTESAPPLLATSQMKK